ncbi:MAG TPA: NRDE family protein, partial [Thioalkalivibrio sp.]|nr:NRDE family protein [Thioalkalivibrio sp.]
GDGDELWYCSNRGASPRRLEPGLYGLSNHQLDTPWPKVVRAKQALADLLTRPGFDREKALAILADTTRAADQDLPETGIPLAWERALSAAFIVKDVYGTRCSTLLASSNEGRHLLVERRFQGLPDTWQESEFTWQAT